MADYIGNIGFVSAILICLIKWEWLDYYQVVRKPWMPDAGCYFCLGFWVSIILNLFVTIVRDLAGDESTVSSYLIIPVVAFVCAPFVNIIVTHARGKAE